MLNGTTGGVPVSYEAKGRQYFVIMSNPGGGGGAGGAGGGAGAGGAGGGAGRRGEPTPTPPPLDPSIPTGAIAFALPKEK
jgi:hypothetical protein